MRVLVACEFSGVVRRAFKAKGHDAWSCDLLESMDSSSFHIKGDVLGILNDGWDLMIAHPPCTYLCNSGVRWLGEPSDNPERWEALQKASDFFYQLLNAPINKICIENPVPHKYGGLPPYTQKVQPWMFGHGETKATCLWLKNLPLLITTDVVEGREARVHKMGPSKDRGLLRSITYQGIADAMAEQWTT